MQILVTGASSGIGREVAAYLAATYIPVMGTYLTGKSTYAKAGPDATAGFDQCQWDVRRDPPLQVIEYARRCTAFVHCAGITYLASYEAMHERYVQDVLETNILGTMNLFRLMAKEAPTGARAVVISSVAAYTPMRLSAAYNASKAAQDALVRQAAREFGARFSVVGVRPGYVKETKLADYVMEQACKQRNMSEKEFHAYNMKTSITGRYPTMAEVVQTIVWAATEAPAQALTGSFLNPSCGS